MEHESNQSKEIYYLNQERIKLIKTIENSKQRKVSKDKIRRIITYIRKGAYSYIKDRLKTIFSKNKSCEKTEITEDKIRGYNDLGNSKIVIYMALYGEYDKIYEPLYISPGVDYVIFTDMEVPTDSVWKKRSYVNEDFMKLNNRDKNRFLKILPHKVFQEYEYSIYLDSSYQIATDLRPFVSDMGDAYLGVHKFDSPYFYDQVNIIWALNRAKKEDIDAQVETYKQNGMPNKYGYFWNAVLVRKHMYPMCVKIMDDWWKEYISTTSKRDQVSLPYVLWNNNVKINEIYSMGGDIYSNPRLVYKGHLYNEYSKNEDEIMRY